MKGRWKYVALFLFLAVALFLVFRSLNQPATNHRIALPNGGRILLRDLTLGTNHAYLAGNIFQKLAARILPSQLKARFRIKLLTVTPHDHTREALTLVAWVEDNPVTNIALRICDEAGREQSPERENVSTLTVADGARLSAHLFSSFPRRGRYLTLRAYSRTNLHGEFRVANPAYRKYPVWRPEALPIKREANGFSFTLTRFSTGVQSTKEFAGMNRHWTEIEYEYGPPDFISGPWSPALVVLTDATGNRIQRQRPAQGLVTSIRPRPKNLSPDPLRGGVVSLPVMLWQDEPAWNIHLELERRSDSGFRTNEFWDVNDVAIPDIGQTNYVKASTTRYAANVVFASLANYEAGNRPHRNPILKWEVKYPSPSSLRVFLQNVTDQHGRPIARSGFHVHPLPAESERLNFRFVIHQVISLDFLAKPQLAPTNVIDREHLFFAP